MLQRQQACEIVGEVGNASPALLLKLRELSLVHFESCADVLVGKWRHSSRVEKMGKQDAKIDVKLVNNRNCKPFKTYFGNGSR